MNLKEGVQGVQLPLGPPAVPAVPAVPAEPAVPAVPVDAAMDPQVAEQLLAIEKCNHPTYEKLMKVAGSSTRQMSKRNVKRCSCNQDVE